LLTEVVVMERNSLTFHLDGTGVPSGELGLDALGRVATALQELATRVGRFVVGQRGPGRTVSSAAKVVNLRLAGLRDGSTQLDVSFGEAHVLPLDVGLEQQIADRFWDIVEGVSVGKPPSWVTPAVAESTVRVIDAFGVAAEQTGIRRADGRTATWRRESVPREPWLLADEVPAAEAVAATGRLEKVDLANRRFRIRDDVGNTIALEDVTDADEVGPLVGQRTTAVGAPIHTADGRLRGIRGAAISPAPLPEAWRPGGTVSLSEIAAAHPGPDPSGVPGVTDEDIDNLLMAIDG
jgi:hypothetical protein